MKSARKDLLGPLGPNGEMLPFTVTVTDDAERFTEGGSRPVSETALPITITWPMVVLEFNNPEQVRRAFMAFGTYARIYPALQDAIHGLLDEVGIPRFKSY